MSERAANRRGFIKGAFAGLAGAFLALHGAGTVKAVALQAPRRLRHIVDVLDSDRIDDTRAVIAESRPRRGTTELWWIRQRQDGEVLRWCLIEIGRSPDGEGMVNWDIAYWREGDL